MANSIGTVNLDNQITRSSYEIIRGEKEVTLMNWKKRTMILWEKRVYTIECENMKPELFESLETLLRGNTIQTLTMDKDTWWISGWVSCHCKLNWVKHTAWSVVRDKNNYRVSFNITCEEVNPR